MNTHIFGGTSIKVPTDTICPMSGVNELDQWCKLLGTAKADLPADSRVFIGHFWVEDCDINMASNPHTCKGLKSGRTRHRGKGGQRLTTGPNSENAPPRPARSKEEVQCYIQSGVYWVLPSSRGKRGILRARSHGKDSPRTPNTRPPKRKTGSTEQSKKKSPLAALPQKARPGSSLKYPPEYFVT